MAKASFLFNVTTQFPLLTTSRNHSGSIYSVRETTSVNFLERVPAWKSAIEQWKWAWSLHIICISGLFFSVALYCCFALVLCILKWKLNKCIIYVLIMVLLMCIIRGVYYSIDPYGYKGVFSRFLNGFVYQIACPFLAGAFALLQIMVLRLTKLDIGQNRLQKTSCIFSVITVHCVVTLVVELTISWNNHTKALVLLSHGYFIVWTILLCVSFIYNGFKLTHYTTEAQKALKELIAFSHAKKHLDITGVSGLPSPGGSGSGSSMPRPNVQRLTKPMLKLTNEEHKTYSIVSNSESTGTGSDSCSQNMLHLSSERESSSDGKYAVPTSKHKIKSRRIYVRSPRNSVTMGRIVSCEPLNEPIIKRSVTSASTPAMIWHRLSRIFQRDNSTKDNTADIIHDLRSFRFTELARNDIYLCENNCTTSSIVSDNIYKTSSFVESATKESLLCEDTCEDVSYTKTSEYPIEKPTSDVDDYVSLRGASIDTSCIDNGYMADTELQFVKRKGKRTKRLPFSSNPVLQPELDDQFELPSENCSVPSLELPNHPSTLSLCRIRQSKMLQRVIGSTYVATFFGFVVCLLHLYSVFGSYGILGLDSQPEAWPWIVFQTFKRLTEAGMMLAVVAGTFTVIRYRQQRLLVRRNKLKNAALKQQNIVT